MRSGFWVGAGAFTVVGVLGSWFNAAGLPALLALWLLVGLAALFRRRPPGTERWLLGAAALVSALAGAAFFQAGRDAVSSLVPLPVDVQGWFHLTVAGGLGFLLTALLLFLAWGPVRRGEAWVAWAFLVGAIPATVVIGAAAVAEVVSWRHVYGSVHGSVWMLLGLLVSAAGTLAWGVTLGARPRQAGQG